MVAPTVWALAPLGKHCTLKLLYYKSMPSLDTIVNALHNDAVGIFPCDTIWGLIGRASPAVGKKINRLKNRNPATPLIQLIHNPEQLLPQCPTLTQEHHMAMATYWPGPVTLILPTATGSIGARQPNFKPLIDLLNQTQFPVFSTSINTSGMPPCTDIIPTSWREAVDFVYMGSEPPGHVASRILDITRTPFQWIR
jgi:L-threonylcarbamoyladenylate synthase